MRVSVAKVTLIFCGKMTIIFVDATTKQEGNSMQVNGIGNEHNSSHHNVTNCLHEHSVGKKDSGAFRSSGIDSLTLSGQNSTSQQEGQLSLSAWLDKTLHSGKDLLQRIWGSDPTAVTNGTGGQSLEAQVMAAFSDDGMAAATALVQPETARIIHQNPYFVTAADDRPPKIWQKMKVKMKDVTGRLSGRLPGRLAGFWAKGAFQTKQEHPKEDLRKKSKYHQDKLEIDCVLTDDSYLQDSYNRKGEYSRLAGDMRGNMSTRK